MTLLRYAALAGALVLGLGTAMVAATPAYAASWTISSASQCDATNQIFKVSWNISNYESAQLELTGARSNAVPSGTSTLSYVTPSGESPLPIRLPVAGGKGAALGAATPSSVTIIQRVPGVSTQATVSFIGSFVGSTTSFTINGSQALSADCVTQAGGGGGDPIRGPTATASSTGAGGASSPDAGFASECDGTVTVKLTNRRTSGNALTFNVHSGDGVFAQATSVAVRQTATVTVPAEHATGVRVTATGLDRGPYSWARPAACASPSASASPTGAGAERRGGATNAHGRGDLEAAGRGAAGTHGSRRVVAGIGLLVLAVVVAILSTLLLRHYRRAYQPARRPRPAPPGTKPSAAHPSGAIPLAAHPSGAIPVGGGSSGSAPANDKPGVSREPRISRRKRP